MRRSRVLEKLRRGDCAVCIGVSMAPAPEVVEMAGLAGFDVCWIDMEHRDYSYREVNHMIRAARVQDMDAMVRLRREGYFSYFRPFEAGATGIMVPHCMSGDDARQVARNARYYPIGLRGFETVGADADYGTADPHEYMEWVNRETFVIVQIEDREAVEDVDAIAATPGIDLLFVGPADLSQSYGVPLQTQHPEVQAAMDRVDEAARKYGKFWGAPARGAEGARSLIERGARFVNVGTDFGILHEGLRRIFGECQAMAASLGVG